MCLRHFAAEANRVYPVVWKQIVVLSPRLVQRAKALATCPEHKNYPKWWLDRLTTNRRARWFRSS